MEKAMSIVKAQDSTVVWTQASLKKKKKHKKNQLESNTDSICWASLSVLRQTCRMSALTPCPAEYMRFSWQVGPEPLGQEHFLGQGGHYPCEMPLDDLTVGEPFFQWRCHLSPPELPVVAVCSALWSDTTQAYPFCPPFSCLWSSLYFSRVCSCSA